MTFKEAMMSRGEKWTLAEMNAWIEKFMEPQPGETEKEVALGIWARYDAEGKYIGGRSESIQANPKN